jgi:hypothetical protein
MKQRRLRFHLGFLMSVIALIAIPLAFYAERERRRAEAEQEFQREIVRGLEEMIRQAQEEQDRLQSISGPKPGTMGNDSLRAVERPQAPRPPAIPEFEIDGDFKSSE